MRKEGEIIFCVCFKALEGGWGGGGMVFFILHKMKIFVGIDVGLLYFTKISLCMHFITIYKVKLYKFIYYL